MIGATMPYLNFAITAGGRNWTIPTIISGIYMLKLTPLLLNSFGDIYIKYKKYIILPLLFIILLTFMNAFYSDQVNRIPIINSTIVMCYIMYLFFILHFEKDRKAYKFALNGFVFGNIILSILFLLKIGIEIDIESGRLSMFGSNENQLGIYMDIAIITIISSWIINDAFNIGKLRYAIIPIVFPMLSLIVATGSRTALVILISAIVVTIITKRSSSGISKLVFTIVGFVALFYSYRVLVPEGSVMDERIVATIEDGNTSGRTDIVENLIPYAMKHPIFGVGQTGYVEVARLALKKVSVINGITYGYSPHNVLIEILLYTGVIGLILMLIFWIGIIRSSYRIYKYKGKPVYMLLLIPILACIASGQILGDKYAWLIYAIIIYCNQNIIESKTRNIKLQHEKNMPC